MQKVLTLNLAIIEAIIAATEPLDGLKVHLATGVPTPSQDNVVGDFTEATFTGSVAQDLVWGTPYYNPDGNAAVPMTDLQFICTAGTPSETIIAYYVTDSAGTVLKFWDMLPEPVPIGRVNDGVTVEFEYVEV
jgi:hypothetical protein